MTTGPASTIWWAAEYAMPEQRPDPSSALTQAVAKGMPLPGEAVLKSS
jgi:hypothetical protein